MSSVEAPEMITPELLIVLGKNIGVGSTPEDMRRSPHHLSPESRLNTLAAGEIWTPGTDILFTSGHTAGLATPSESASMKRYFIKKYPEIPRYRLDTEETSIDTAGNAEQVAMMLGERGVDYRRIGLVTVGYHLQNAFKLFENYGVGVNDLYRSEDVVRTIHPVMNRYVNLWSNSDRVASERRKETIRSVMLPMDPKGKLLRQITTRTRK